MPKKTLKTYFGIPKTPIDDYTIFYASFDGSTTAEVGGAPKSIGGTKFYADAGTGAGIGFYDDASGGIPKMVWSGLKFYPVMTFDLVLTKNAGSPNYKWSDFISIKCTNKAGAGFHSPYNLFRLETENAYGLQIYGDYGSTLVCDANAIKPVNHVRIVMDTTQSKLTVFLNGKYASAFGMDFSTINLNDTLDIALGNCGYVISDVSVSCIDRGSYFPTLPKDFVDKKAVLSTAFTRQRQNYTDCANPQSTVGIVKAKKIDSTLRTYNGISDEFKGDRYIKRVADSGTALLSPEQHYNITELKASRGLTATQAVDGAWASGDTIVVTGLRGENISGIIDTDTALAKTTQPLGTNVTQIFVDDVSKLVVGDVVALVYASGSNGDYACLRTITAINATGSYITVDSALSDTTNIFLLVEVSSLTSAPAVKGNVTGTATAGTTNTITLPSTLSATDDTYNGLDIMITAGTGAGQRRTISDYVGSTKVVTLSSNWATNPDATSQFIIYKVPVVGTWSGLSTGQATFTFGTNLGMANSDIQVEYSLVTPFGAGKIPVYDTMLQGEANGQKLTVNPGAHFRDDFSNKISGDNVLNPHTAKYVYNGTLQAPFAFSYEFSDTSYKKLWSNDLTNYVTVTNSTSGGKAQILLQFNLIRIVEERIGMAIPSIDKIGWIRDNISVLQYYMYASGSSPTGNKVTAYRWVDGASIWGGSAQINTSGSIGLVSTSTGTANSEIDNYGIGSVILYAENSDGTTPSVVNLAYANVDITFKAPSGYDVLAPENPMKVAGKSNILFVRKSTKEVVTMFPASADDRISVFGRYTPQAPLAPTDYVTVLAEIPEFLVTDLSSAVGHLQGTHYWNNILFKIGMDRPELLGQFGYGRVFFSEDLKAVNIGAKIAICSTGFSSYYSHQKGNSAIKKPMVGMARYLVAHGSELKMFVIARYANDGTMSTTTQGVGVLIPIGTRPLIKDADGIIRGSIVPKDWLTPDGEIQGYLDSNGNLVATYQ